jgi:hypothetical protein
VLIGRENIRPVARQHLGQRRHEAVAVSARYEQSGDVAQGVRGLENGGHARAI